HLHVRQVPILLRVIESVPDDELRLDREADVLRLKLHFARRRFVEERRRLHDDRSTALDVREHFLHRQTGVDDVFDDQHRLAVHVELRLFQNRHDAGREFLVAVRRHLNEIERCEFERDVPHQIGAEEHRAFEDSEDDQFRAGEVGADLPSHLRNALIDLRFAEQRRLCHSVRIPPSRAWAAEMSVTDVGLLHSRYVRLNDRFKSIWTYHQFASGIFKNFLEQPLPYTIDFRKIYDRMKAISETLNGAQMDHAAAEVAATDLALDRATTTLIAADQKIGPSLVRRFFERLKRQDDAIIQFLIKF